MKTWHSTFGPFTYAFDDVVSAVWNRYPNDYSNHIISEDILESRIEGNKIFIKKLIIKKGSKYLKMISFRRNFLKSFQIVPCIEESIYDKDSKTLKTYTRNVAHNDKFMMEERCIYSPTVDKCKTSTDLKRSILTHVDYGKLSSTIQRILLMQYKMRLKSTDLGLRQVLKERTNSASEKVNYFNDTLSSKIENPKTYIHY